MEDPKSKTRNQKSAFDGIISFLLAVGLITLIFSYFVLSPKKIENLSTIKVIINEELSLSIAELSKYPKRSKLISKGAIFFASET